MKREQDHHPDPQVLVDLLEGAPVVAKWRDHLLQCARCREQLEHLRETLALVRQADLEDPDDGYWSQLSARVAERVQARPQRAPSWRLWAAAAALVAAVAAGLGGHWMLSRGPQLPEAPREAILPPIEQDAEYQFLLSVVHLAQGREDLAESLELETTPVVDVTELSADEKERLRQALERDLDAEGHAKS